MILYEKGTTNFSKNGLGMLPNVLDAKVVDEINGEYSLTFEYPMSEPMAKELVEDRIVKCKVSDGTKQCFVIKTIKKNFDTISVYCTHLFYLLKDNFVDDTYPQNKSPKPFLDQILSRANYQLPFTTTSDIATTASARYVRKNIVETILGDIDNSMYHLFGMELKRDNWNIGLKARLGSDKGEKLIFGKNITGVTINVDTTGIYTRIMPIGFDGLLLPEKYVDASNINSYPYPRICLYEFPDIVYDPDDPNAYHTLNDAYQALRDAVNELYAKGINLPLINIKVDWLELSKTEEYKQYSALERVDLGDTITCNLFGMDYTTRVIKTTYNPLTDRIDKFEIGTIQPNIVTQMNKVEFDVTQINPSSILEQAQENASSLITQAMGGYVYKTNNELYIMDNPDPAQAVKVWRWNINGLGYSSTGINGTYALAMTMDGSIVADMITTGQLNANVISASTIIGVINGNSSQLLIDADQIDLTASDVLNILSGNQINLTSKNITIASTNFSVDNGGNMSCSNATITGGDINLVDDGLTETVSKIKISGRDNVVTNEIYSYGMEINNTNGTKIEISTGTTDNIYIEEKHSDNSKEKVTISSGTIWQRYEDTNGNITRWATLFPGTNNDSAFTLGTGSSTNFEIHNEQNSTYAKIKGSLVATDSNGNETFSVDGSTGNTTINGDINNKFIDLFNDTAGNDWETMIKNKIDWCIANLNTTKQNTMSFINGGWAGVNYGCGVFSIIGSVYQLIWVCSDFIAYCRKSGTTYTCKRTESTFGTQLFSGTSTGADIQLSDDINNYTYLEIIGGSTYGGIVTTRIQIQNTVSVCLTSTEEDTSDANNWGIIIPNSKYTLDNYYLRFNGASRVWKYENMTNWIQDRVNSIYVFKVIGYKY